MKDIDNISIPDFDFEYKLWRNELVYLNNELDIYKNRLEAIKTEYKGQIDQSDIDYSKEKIKEYKIDILSLKKRITIREDEMSTFSKDYPITRDHQHYFQHKRLKDEMINLSVEYTDLIRTINHNLEKYLYV